MKLYSRVLVLSLMVGLGLALSGCNLSMNAASTTGFAPTFGPIASGGEKTGGNSINTTSPTIPPTPTITASKVPSTQQVGPTAAPPFTFKIPKLNPEMMGIQAFGYASEWPELMERSYNMGFRWVKLQLSWKELEPAKGQFSSQMDVISQNGFVTGTYRGAGFHILLSIAKAPDWARPENARGQNDGPPANPQDLVDFINVVMVKFKDAKIAAIEIWNEPNAIADWTGAPLTAAAYDKLFTPAYNAIRAANKDIMIISGAPTPTGDSGGSVDDRRWLQDLYKTGLPITDPNFAIGVHPYGWANAPDTRCCANPSNGWDDHPTFFFLDTLYDYRNIMVQNNHTQGRMWVTEFGWSSFDGLKQGSHVDGKPAMPPNNPDLAWMTRLNENQQAEYIIRAFELAQTTDLANYVGPMFLWNLNFSMLQDFVVPDKPSRTEAGFSVLNADSFPRAAYNALQAAQQQK